MEISIEVTEPFLKNVFANAVGRLEVWVDIILNSLKYFAWCFVGGFIILKERDWHAI